MFKYIMVPFVMPLTGLIHNVETAAKRYVDGIKEDSLTNGGFYGSKGDKPTGFTGNQNSFRSDFDNVEYQNNAEEAIIHFVFAL